MPFLYRDIYTRLRPGYSFIAIRTSVLYTVAIYGSFEANRGFRYCHGALLETAGPSTKRSAPTPGLEPKQPHVFRSQQLRYYCTIAKTGLIYVFIGSK